MCNDIWSLVTTFMASFLANVIRSARCIACMNHGGGLSFAVSINIIYKCSIALSAARGVYTTVHIRRCEFLDPASRGDALVANLGKTLSTFSLSSSSGCKIMNVLRYVSLPLRVLSLHLVPYLWARHVPQAFTLQRLFLPRDFFFLDQPYRSGYFRLVPFSSRGFAVVIIFSGATATAFHTFKRPIMSRCLYITSLLAIFMYCLVPLLPPLCSGCNGP